MEYWNTTLNGILTGNLNLSRLAVDYLEVVGVLALVSLGFTASSFDIRSILILSLPLTSVSKIFITSSTTFFYSFIWLTVFFSKSKTPSATGLRFFFLKISMTVRKFFVSMVPVVSEVSKRNLGRILLAESDTLDDFKEVNRYLLISPPAGSRWRLPMTYYQMDLPRGRIDIHIMTKYVNHGKIWVWRR